MHKSTLPALIFALAACSSVTDFDRFHEGRDGGDMDARIPDGGDPPDTGDCRAETCNGDDDDCDGMIDEGLTDTDPLNCGSCGNVCAERASATPACAGGTCVNECDADRGDCDGDYDTGCETDLSHPDTCGTCDTVCPADQACSASAGCVTDCPGGETICGRSCVDTDTSIAHCGGCDAPCADRANASVVCDAGSCDYTCNAGFDDCDGVAENGCETDLTTTSDCGGCGNVCNFANGTSACTSMVCELVGCDTGYEDCNTDDSDGCEADLSSTSTCGSCAVACSAPANASTTCGTAGCEYACNDGFDNCNADWTDGCEASLSSPSTCRSCSTVCPVGMPVCGTTGCGTGCGAGEVLCSSTCTNTATDPSNCGGCGTPCTDRPNSSPTCSASTCGISCDTGYANCNGGVTDGCEVNTRTLSNCGSCGTTCGFTNATASCSTGTCTFVSCNAPYANCNSNLADGCEANTATSIMHCGGCARPCTVANGTPGCTGGSCYIATCAAGYDDCNGSYADGCERLLPTYYRDDDGDGYGAPGTGMTACSAPAGYVNLSGDCNDANAAIRPGAAETCNGIDDDCDGVTDNGPAETCNDSDDDCDGQVDEGLYSTRSASFSDSAVFRNIVGQPAVAFDGTNFGVAFIAEPITAGATLLQVFFAVVPGSLTASGTIPVTAITTDTSRKDGVTVLRAGPRWFVAYQDTTVGNIRYTFYGGPGTTPTWTTLRVPATGQARTYAALADSAGRVHVVYSDGAEMRLAIIDGSVTPPSVVDALRSAGSGSQPITDLAIAPIGTDTGVLVGRSDNVHYRRFNPTGGVVATSGNLLPAGEQLSRSYYFNLNLVYGAAPDVAVALVPGVNSASDLTIRYASFSGLGAALGAGVEAAGFYSYAMAHSPVTRSYAIGISSTIRRYTFSHVSISPSPSAGALNEPMRLIGGQFGPFRYAKTNSDTTSNAVQVHGMGCGL